MAWTGFFSRLLASLVLVYATFNPTGRSYYHWALAPLVKDIGTFDALKFLAGVMLFAGWVVYLQATRRSIGWNGALLVAALCGGLIWLLAEWHVVDPANRAVLTNLGLVVAAIILTIGMSWSHVSRKLSGQTDIDIVN